MRQRPAGSAWSIADLGLDGVDIGSAHFADGHHLSVLNAPKAEGSGDIAILIERDRPDDAFIFDRLALHDELQGLGKSLLARMDDLALGIEDLRDRLLDGGRIWLASLGDSK